MDGTILLLLTQKSHGGVILKRTLAILIVFLFLFISSSSIFSSPGIGVILGEPSGASIKIGNFPVLGISWSFRNRLNATVDWWLFNSELVEPLDWYLGVGANIYLGFNQGVGNTNIFGAGFRVPVGLQWWLLSELELFLELAPGIAITTNPNSIVGFDMGGGIGMRYYFEW